MRMRKTHCASAIDSVDAHARVRSTATWPPRRTILASVLREKGDLAAAEPLLRESLALRRKIGGNESPDVAQSLRNLGLLLIDASTIHARPRPSLRQAVDLSRRVFPAGASTAGGSARRARPLAPRDRTSGGGGAAVARGARDSRQQDRRRLAAGGGSANVSGCMRDAARSIGGGADTLEAARDVRRKTFGADSWQAAEVETHLALLARQQGHPKEAAALFDGAVNRLRNAFGPTHPLVRSAERARAGKARL